MAKRLFAIHLRADSDKVPGATKDWIGELVPGQGYRISWGRSGALNNPPVKPCSDGAAVRAILERAEIKRREGYWTVTEIDERTAPADPKPANAAPPAPTPQPAPVISTIDWDALAEQLL